MWTGKRGEAWPAEQRTKARGQGSEGTRPRRPGWWHGTGQKEVTERAPSPCGIKARAGPPGMGGQTPSRSRGTNGDPGHKTPGEFDFFEKRQGQTDAALPFKMLIWREDLNWGSPACGSRVRIYRGKPCTKADGIINGAMRYRRVSPGGKPFIPATQPTATDVATERFNALIRPPKDAPAHQPSKSHKLTQDAICHTLRQRKRD